jgi:putative ABC transport system ATP-binding protein
MDTLKLEKITPDFFSAVEQRSSDIWGVDISFKKGCFYAISAASGKGKSTLLNYLFGVRLVPNGRAYIGDLCLNDCSDDQRCQLRKNHLSMVFQDLQLFGELTMKENLELKRSLTPERTWEEIEKWCEILGVASFMDRKCMQMSLGQQQRVALVRALISDCSWLFLDEPCSHLDAHNAQVVLDLVQSEAHRRQAGVLWTTLESKPALGQSTTYYC